MKAQTSSSANDSCYAVSASFSNQTDIYFRFYLYVDTLDYGSTDIAGIFVVKGFVDNIYVNIRYTVLDGVHLRFGHYDNGDQDDGTYSINQDQWYRIEGRYTSSPDTVVFRVDGTDEANVSMSSPRVDSNTAIIGWLGNDLDSKYTRTGVDDIIYIEVVGVDNTGWIGQ